MRKSPNPKIFMALALGTLVVGAGANYMAFSSLSDQQANCDKLKAQVKPTTQVQSELDKSNADLAATTTQLKYLEGGVPDFAYVPTMLAQLEKFGKDNGLQVTGVRPTPPPVNNQKQADGEKPERKPYDELIIEVKAHGKYADVCKFVSALQTFPKIVATRSISMTPKNDPTHPDPGGLDIVIDLKAFVFNSTTTPASQIPAAAGTAPASAGTGVPQIANGGVPAKPGASAAPNSPSPSPQKGATPPAQMPSTSIPMHASIKGGPKNS